MTSTNGLFSCGPQRRRGGGRLLGVELDDQLLLQRHVDLASLGQLMHEHPEPVRHDLKPTGNRPVALSLPRDEERRRLERLRLDVDDVVLGHPIARDVHLLAIDEEVTVADELTRGPASAGQARPVHDVVQPRLEDLQQVVAGLARPPHCLLVIATELLFQHAVAVLRLLLLLQLQQVLALLDPRAAVLARRIRPALEGGVTADKVGIQATRDARYGSGVAGHRVTPSALRASAHRPDELRFSPRKQPCDARPSDPPALRRAASVMRLRRHIGDDPDHQSGRLKRADRGFPPGTGTFDEDVDLAQSMLLSLPGCALRRHLRRERRRLAGALEAHVAGRGPADHVPLRVGDRHDRVVESALDVRVTMRDVLLLLAPDLLYSPSARPRRHARSPRSSRIGTRSFVSRSSRERSSRRLLRTCTPRNRCAISQGPRSSLAGARYDARSLLTCLLASDGLLALPVYRQPAAVPDSLIGADLDLASDVGGDLPPQITLDLVVGVDVVAQPDQILVGQIARP